MTILKLLLMSLILVASQLAYADQCAWNSADVANKAAKIFGPVEEFLDYCEPCGEKVPKKVKLNSVNVRPAEMAGKIQEGQFEVLLNGKAFDLAYVFIKKKGTKKEWQNIGDLANCRDQAVAGNIEELTYPAKLSPREQKKSRTKNYIGTFENKKNQVKIVIKTQKLHGPDWLKINIGLISSEWGDSRGGMVGYLQFNHKKPTYFSSFDKCAFFLKYNSGKKGIEVKPNENCGSSLKAKIEGFYDKK